MALPIPDPAPVTKIFFVIAIDWFDLIWANR